MMAPRNPWAPPPSPTQMVWVRVWRRDLAPPLPKGPLLMLFRRRFFIPPVALLSENLKNLCGSVREVCGF